MNTVKNQALPAPPSLMAALRAGFDAITNHIELVLFPIILDIFLWFGPHLRLEKLIKGVLDEMMTLPGMDAPDAADALALGREFWLFVSQRLNLFSMLRSYPVGIPSLMAGSQPADTPLGRPLGWEVGSLGEALGGWVVMAIVGLVLGALFFLVVAQAAVMGDVNWRRVLRVWPWASGQILLLAIMWTALLLLITIPGSCMLTFVALTGLAFDRIGILILGGVVMWIVFPLLLSPHGIFLNGRRAWHSVLDSIRLTRLTLPKTSLLFLVIVIISQGLDVLWRVPAEVSWLALVGIAGHALVATSLLAASFIYYHDADLWVQKMLEQARSKGSLA